MPPLDELTQIPNSDLMLAKPLGDWTYSKSIWSRFTKSGKQQQAANWLQRKGAVMYYIGGGIVTIIVIIIVVMLIF